MGVTPIDLAFPSRYGPKELGVARMKVVLIATGSHPLRLAKSVVVLWLQRQSWKRQPAH